MYEILFGKKFKRLLITFVEMYLLSKSCHVGSFFFILHVFRPAYKGVFLNVISCHIINM